VCTKIQKQVLTPFINAGSRHTRTVWVHHQCHEHSCKVHCILHREAALLTIHKRLLASCTQNGQEASEMGDIVGMGYTARKGDTMGIGCAPCQPAAHYSPAAIACRRAAQLHGRLCKPVSAHLSEAGQHYSCLYNSKHSVIVADIHKLLFCS